MSPRRWNHTQRREHPQRRMYPQWWKRPQRCERWREHLQPWSHARRWERPQRGRLYAQRRGSRGVAFGGPTGRPISVCRFKREFGRQWEALSPACGRETGLCVVWGGRVHGCPSGRVYDPDAILGIQYTGGGELDSNWWWLRCLPGSTGMDATRILLDRQRDA